jgi:hypothetical protein
MGMKITIKEFEEFEKQFLFDKINNPYYRLGQAFLNKFPEIDRLWNDDGDLGAQQARRLWECDNRKQVLELIDWYIDKYST